MSRANQPYTGGGASDSRTALHPAIGRNRYCFPAAAAALTGKPTHEIAKATRRALDKRAIMGVWAWDGLTALTDGLGVKIQTEMGRDRRVSKHARREYRRMTFRRWLDDAAPGIYIITAAHHWIAVEKGAFGNFLVDTMNREPVRVGDHDDTHIPQRGIVTAIFKVRESRAAQLRKRQAAEQHEQACAAVRARWGN